MKQVSEMPTSWQFVAVWQSGDSPVWSDTLRWFGNKLKSYNSDKYKINGGFTEKEEPDFYNSVGALYFIAD